ncbi:MAG: hypothetical protein IIA88_10795, partial [Bacteroidetes bacterium]|nr:hypothetical protein [Bacteroidota bacterium]
MKKNILKFKFLAYLILGAYFSLSSNTPQTTDTTLSDTSIYSPSPLPVERGPGGEVDSLINLLKTTTHDTTK